MSFLIKDEAQCVKGLPILTVLGHPFLFKLATTVPVLALGSQPLADYICAYPQASTVPIKAKSYQEAEEPASLGQLDDYTSEAQREMY